MTSFFSSLRYNRGYTMCKGFGRISPVNLLFYALCFVGVFFPTSVGGRPSGLLFMAACGVSLVLLVLLAAYCRLDMQILRFVSIPVPILLVTFTGIALMRRISGASLNFEEFPLFSVCAFAYCIKMRNSPTLKSVQVLTWWSIVNCLIGFPVVFGSAIVGDLLTNYYNAFYPELVPMMLLKHAPVLTYATHSLAAFFLYTFFWINLSAYRRTTHRRYMFFAICHLVLCFSLTSHTSFVLSLAAVVELLCFTFKRHPKSTITTTALLIYLVSYTLTGFLGMYSWKDVADVTVAFWQSGASGMSRFGSEGGQTAQLAYLKNNWAPIGLMQSDSINPLTTDNAPLDYVLRGSFPLLFLMYGGLWIFLRRNLDNASDRYHLLFSILATELGIEILPYSRSLCLLPGIVLLLIGLDRIPEPVLKPTKSWTPKIIWLPRFRFTGLVGRKKQSERLLYHQRSIRPPNTQLE